MAQHGETVPGRSSSRRSAFGAGSLRARAKEVPDRIDADAVLLAMAREESAEDAVMARLDASRAPMAAPLGRFAAAATVWALATFALCYVAIPLGYTLSGLRPFMLPWTLPGEVVAFGLTWAATLGWLAVRSVRQGGLAIDPHGLAASDRIPAAMAGGLLVWGLMHNILPGLMTFGTMSAVFLGTFLLSNFLENALFGTILGTVTRTRKGAFVAGALFQATLGLSAWVL